MKTAVLIPCCNEAMTIRKVVQDFRRELPDASVWVYDNNSTDGSAEITARGGAIVRLVPQQGKGFVVRRMFREVDADVYVMVDVDDTYPAEDVHKLIAPIAAGGVDMVNGDRLSSTYAEENKRPGHGFGNALVCALIRFLWGRRVRDVMTGYRAFSRFFVKTCPVLSNGFEVETEMTIHTIDKRMSLVEVPVQYRDRRKGSRSKLNTVSDGIKVIRTVSSLFRLYRPLCFYSMVGLFFGLAGLAMFSSVFAEYLESGLVPRQPTLIVSVLFFIVAILSWICGLILGAIKRQLNQVFEVMALSRPGQLQ